MANFSRTTVAFKALVVPILSDPTLDPKYRKALQDANVIVDAALG